MEPTFDTDFDRVVYNRVRNSALCEEEERVNKKFFEKYKDVLVRNGINSSECLHMRIDDYIFDMDCRMRDDDSLKFDDRELLENIFDELWDSLPAYNADITVSPEDVEQYKEDIKQSKKPFCTTKALPYNYEPSYSNRSNVLGWVFFGCILLYGAFVVLGHIL